MRAPASFFAKLTCGLLAAVALLSFAPPAMAYLVLCNFSHSKIWTAVAYNGDIAAAGIVSEGWWSLSPGLCTQVMGDIAEHRFVRVFAENETGMTWDGDEEFCVSPLAFTIYNAQYTADCVETRKFIAVSNYGHDKYFVHFTP
ncbi:DUF1036 domain-containing protein [Sorangium cellulosum]|uniref:DUF1036 domain-containing protein n=1 Tax=Sorangium cellulosum TaxID=56 RepID=UPI003D9A76B1